MYFSIASLLKSIFSYLIIGTQSIRPMGIKSNDVSTRDENEPKATTEYTTNLRQRLSEYKSPKTTSSETCVNHRVTVSNQYECPMLSHTCGTLPSDDEVILGVFSGFVSCIKTILSYRIFYSSPSNVR